MNRYGHKQEFIVVPEGEGWCGMVPVLGGEVRGPSLDAAYWRVLG